MLLGRNFEYKCFEFKWLKIVPRNDFSQTLLLSSWQRLAFFISTSNIFKSNNIFRVLYQQGHISTYEYFFSNPHNLRAVVYFHSLVKMPYKQKKKRIADKRSFLKIVLGVSN